MVKFGLLLSNQHPIGDSISVRFDELLEQVRLARDYGFDFLGTGQHFLTSPWQAFQQIPLLARVAAEAGEMWLGAIVVLPPLLHPVEVAEEMATLDIICKGRFVFGVGLGYRDVENQAFGIPKEQRVGRLVESLEIIKRLWTEDKVTYEGKYYRLKDVTMTIRPVQKPYPPIWIAANNDAAVVRAAKMGDAWVVNPHATLATLERQIKLYKETLREIGKPFPKELPIIKELFIAEDRGKAFDECRPYLEEKFKSYVEWGQDKALPGNETFALPFQELAKDRFIIGDPQDCISALKLHLEKLGTNFFIFRIHWPGMPNSMALRTIKLLGEEVMPRFKGVRVT